MERIICLVIGYACGLFQTGYIIGKVHKTDIREHGSGNAGTTNAFRTFGKKAGAITLLGDCLKCVLAIVIVRMVYGNSMNGILPLLTLYAALTGGYLLYVQLSFLRCSLQLIMCRFVLSVHMRLLLSWSLFLGIWGNMEWISRIPLNFIL